ncbi:maleylacetoacetate isomerase [Kangiella sediminilitoris]|uniref:Maleylacetoacetate isomerase n=1 Tax=Kangiella sediminilitoris TaxID=1144748 RepID=A0A1B3BA56_9GAMM|nr:maleylacetoacetate isomerase [Kangiella sediminilitoris]AOE49691.1 Maleylacetoacetate isomerase [Kangiella sediminilitoris]
MLKLYSYWRSTASFRVRVALNIKRLSYSILPVHLVKDGGEQHKPEYSEKNPQELVPLLDDNGKILSQSMAICEYLEDAFDGPNLLPSEPFLRAKVRSVCQVIACDIHPLDNLRVLKYLKGELKVSDEQKLTWYAHWIHEGFKALESTLVEYKEQGPFCFGEELTLADVFLVSQLYNARRFEVSLDDYPRLVAIEQHCLSLDAFKDAHPDSQPDAVS